MTMRIISTGRTSLRRPIALALALALLAACDDDERGSPDTVDSDLDAATRDQRDRDQEDDTVDDGDSSQDTDAMSDTSALPIEIPDEVVFPEDFMFGTAVAGFQVDMGCPTLDASLCNDTASDWFLYTTDPVTVDDPATFMSGQDVREVGPGFWELYPDDVDRAANELHNDALRVSIEWSRIFPTATDGVEGYDDLLAIADTDAIAAYHAQFQAMRDAGLEPVVTLNHYTLPLWIHDPVGCHQDIETCDPRGWVDKDRTVREIAKYAGFCAEEFGDQVDVWATLNEPLQNMLFGYVQPNAERTHPPAVGLRLDEARTVLDGLIEGHARMYDAVKAVDTVDADGDGEASFIGVVYPLAPIEPASPNRAVDVQAAENIDYLWNQAFLNATALGEYDANLDGTTELRDDLAGRMDYIGVNYYFGLTVSGIQTSLLPDFSPLLTIDIDSLEPGENRPEALPELLLRANEAYGLPVIVTENGDPVSGDDGDASDFMVRNLAAVGIALAEGADVRGYFYWSLMDNFEWNHGMNMDFGLYAVDPDDASKTRTLRPTGETYGEIARTRRIDGARIRAAFEAATAP